MLFHKKGIKNVAERIEAEDKLFYLHSNTDVDYFQGNYLGMPN